jgi:hypothetical protein
VERRAKKLARLPEVLEAWVDERLSGTQVELIAATVPDRHLDRFAETVDDTISIVAPLSVANTQKALAAWVSHADDAAQREAVETGHEPVAGPVPERELSASRTLEDRLVVSGSFDQDAAAVVENALRAAARPDGGGERRSPTQRRADALVEMARFFLAHHTNPPNTGRPDRGVVVFDVAAMFRAILRGDGVHTAGQLDAYLTAQPELGALERGLFLDAFDGAGGTARTLDGHQLTDVAIRHVMVDGILERLFRQDSRIIDYGRSTRIFTESQKRAMAVRDGGSRISGASLWSAQAHHSPEFDQGGSTDVNAGYLKDRREHLDQHRKGFRDRIDPDGTITLIGPDGREHDTRPPNWPGDDPRLPVHTTAEPAPTMPFRTPPSHRSPGERSTPRRRPCTCTCEHHRPPTTVDFVSGDQIIELIRRAA